MKIAERPNVNNIENEAGNEKKNADFKGYFSKNAYFRRYDIQRLILEKNFSVELKSGLETLDMRFCCLLYIRLAFSFAFMVDLRIYKDISI